MRAAGAADRVLTVPADLTRPEGIERVFSAVVDRWGGLDILVNNLGLARGAGILDTTDEDWQEAFDYTLFPAIRATRLAVPEMRRARGRIRDHDRVDLRARGGRPHDLQRGQGRGDQPRESRWRSSSRPTTSA